MADGWTVTKRAAETAGHTPEQPQGWTVKKRAVDSVSSPQEAYEVLARDVYGAGVPALQGAAFGGADEAIGGIAAAGDYLLSGFDGERAGETYSNVRDAIRAEEKAYSEAHPGRALVANIAGSLLGGYGAIKALPAGLTVGGASTGGNIARGAVGGAGGGGLAGFLSEEGGLAERAGGASRGAALGTVLGMAIPAGVGVYTGLRGANRPAPSPLAVTFEDQAAAAQIGQAISRDQATPRDLRLLVDEASTTGKPLALADLGGENIRGTLDSVVNRPGPARSVAREIYSRRQKGQADRLSDDVRENVIDAGYYDTIDALSEARAKAAAPLYERAYGAGALMSPQIAGLLRTPSGSAAIRRAIRTASDELGSANPEDAAEIIAALRGLANTKKAPAPIPMRVLDFAKRGLDDVVEAHRDPMTRKIVTNEARAANGVRTQFRDELIALNPAYGDALSAWSGPTQAIGVVERGRDAFRKAMQPEQVAREFGALSPEDKQFYMIGVARHLQEKIAATPQQSHNAAIRMMTGTDEAKLRAILPPDKADAFVRALDREKRMFSTASETMGGSQTARRLAAQDDMDESLEALLAERAAGTKTTADLVRSAVRWVRERGSGLGNEKVRERIAQMLLSPNADRQRVALQMVEEQIAAQQARRIQGGAFASGQGLSIGSSIGNLNGGR